MEVGAADRRGVGRRRRSRALAAAAARPARAATRRSIKEERLREDPESPRLAGLERDRQNLAHLPNFALPIVETLASWPAHATWGEWLERFGELAPRVLRRPGARRCACSASCARWPRSVRSALEEARDVLAERLRTFDEQPPADRYGRVFVGSPQQARGRAFKVVFVPGLAERLFPQKLREDPLLLDEEMREPLAASAGARLVVQDDRAKTERLLLRLAVGAATDRLWLSYPRLDVGGARPRVPSFYVLDVMRAIVGKIPHHEELQRDAGAAGGAKLDWPAPANPERRDRRGRARSGDAATSSSTCPTGLRFAATRTTCSASTRRCGVRLRDDGRGHDRSWLPQDGLVRVTPAIKPMLDAQRLGARPYSVSALQKFSTCPYQFVLSAIYRFAPNDAPEPLQRLDPLTRGSLFHEVQAHVLRALRTPEAAAADARRCTARAAGAAIGARRHRRCATRSVWRRPSSGCGATRSPRSAAICACGSASCRKSAPWTPEYFEYSFGLADEGRDERSQREPVRIDDRFILRGSVDVIETKEGSAELRITDHKTGRNRTNAAHGDRRRRHAAAGDLRARDREDLWPAGAAKAGCSTRPRPAASPSIRFRSPTPTAAPGSRRSRSSTAPSSSVFCPPAPAERACTWCDFRPICGPDEPRHVARKAAEPLADLTALRAEP